MSETTVAINYDGRRFRVMSDDPNASSAVYRQSGDLLWADFGGGDVRRGSLSGICSPDGSLEFAYSMVLTSGEVVSGRCYSTPSFFEDGRIRLLERWERYGANAATGLSELEEVR